MLPSQGFVVDQGALNPLQAYELLFQLVPCRDVLESPGHLVAKICTPFDGADLVTDHQEA